MFATIDPYILTFSAVTVVATVFMGFWSARKSKTAGDFFVAGRSVSVGWNASAISGEYLSAASFMGIAGMVMSSGYDALWYPVCYACGYLFLLLFIAGPLRRFGAYTIPDFAEGRFDSPVFRKIAVCFVLFIGFFYTMPQMKGAGTTLAYIFPGLPYWAGVVLVGAVITLNVALGGMKGITLVQAVQYWTKMFAISVPIFALMAVYGHYGKQLSANEAGVRKGLELKTVGQVERELNRFQPEPLALSRIESSELVRNSLQSAIREYELHTEQKVFVESAIQSPLVAIISEPLPDATRPAAAAAIVAAIERTGFKLIVLNATQAVCLRQSSFEVLQVAPTQSLKELFPRGFMRLKRDQQVRTKTLPQLKVAVNLAIQGKEFSSQSSPGSALSALMSYPNWVQADVMMAREIAEIPLPAFKLSSHFPEGVARQFEEIVATNGIRVIRHSPDLCWAIPISHEDEFRKALHSSGISREPLPSNAPADSTWLSPFGPLTTKAAKAAKLSAEKAKPYSLLYTYSLIIALVCGTAGLPHILVRFYTNPDGVAAKRTTMWVMILIGIFYVFPPVFGVMGRNLLPELYSGIGAKGTDKIVLELPRLLNEKYAPLGSILSGITCAGAFAAFMSTFSGLLVSMTGALAHDVYGRMLRPKSTPDQRMRMFKVFAVVVGGVAVLLGSFVEPLEINFMVGQAFAIAAASYFPLLFMAVWWRQLTMKGAATGMLVGGLSAVAAISLTSFSTLALAPGPSGELFAMFKPLNTFWAGHPLLRILCEQPALWAVPLAIGLMIVVSKLTRSEVPSDIRMKMLVLHAPEKLGLKQEYIQEHQAGH